jgi:hypothetical protein
MKFAVYSEVDAQSIRENLGRPEYSYYFVLKSFLPALERIGSITSVGDPATELDAIFAECAASGEPCLFVSFSPPHKAFIAHDHPMIVVFAWEFSTVPNEVWNDDTRNDWRTVFARNGRAVTLSNFTARTVKAAMGQDFPILAVPGVVWNRFESIRAIGFRPPVINPTELCLEGLVLDSRTLELSPDYMLRPEPPVPEPQAVGSVGTGPKSEAGSTAELGSVSELSDQDPEAAAMTGSQSPETEIADLAPTMVVRKTLRYRLGRTMHYGLEWYRDVIRDLLPRWFSWILSRIGRASYGLANRVRRRAVPAIEPEPAPRPKWPEARVTLDGVVYTSVLNPTDGRKNWWDLITAFCWAFRDREDATLVLKMVNADLARWYRSYIQMLSQLSPFRCRVVALHGYLEEKEYERLIAATSYYVNVSACEGLCLPLMEFMSCGKPAIAPSHTAMEDYIDESNAFTLDYWVEHNVWPHDPRNLFRTERLRLDWESVRDAYLESYRVAKENPAVYHAMAEAACRTMRDHCSEEIVTTRLEAFLKTSIPGGKAETESLALDERNGSGGLRLMATGAS